MQATRFQGNASKHASHHGDAGGAMPMQKAQWPGSPTRTAKSTSLFILADKYQAFFTIIMIG